MMRDDQGNIKSIIRGYGKYKEFNQGYITSQT